MDLGEIPMTTTESTTRDTTVTESTTPDKDVNIDDFDMVCYDCEGDGDDLTTECQC